jgi:hypothetical protein
VLGVLDELALGLLESLLLAAARLADGPHRFVFAFHARRATPAVKSSTHMPTTGACGTPSILTTA